MTLLDRTSRTTTTTRPATARNTASGIPLAGSYVTTPRSIPARSRTGGTYVTTGRPTPAMRGHYVTTVSEVRPTGGSYTFSG